MSFRTSTDEHDKVESRTVESQTAQEILDPESAPEPSEETGLGTHFTNTFDPKAQALAQAPQTKLQNTSSTMSTKQLQEAAAAAQDADPNGLKSEKLR